MVERAQLVQLCEKGLKDIGYELVDLDFLRENGSWVLRIFIDHPFADPHRAEPAAERQRINFNDCRRASRHLSAVLDVEDPVEGSYRLEVSSPGLKRRLRKSSDFSRFVGFEVAVRLAAPRDGRKKFRGRVLEANAESVTIEAEGGPITLPLADLLRANLCEEY